MESLQLYSGEGSRMSHSLGVTNEDRRTKWENQATEEPSLPLYLGYPGPAQ